MKADVKGSTMKMVTIVPERELKPNEEIIDLWFIKLGDKYKVGFVLNTAESSSGMEKEWIGSKLKNDDETYHVDL